MSLVKSLLTNLTTLFLALILAVLVWVTATREANPTAQNNFQLAITVIERPDGILLSEPVQQVEIRVQAPEATINTLTSTDFRAIVDLEGVEFGQSTVPIQVRFDESELAQVEIIAQFPETTDVTMDQEITKEVSVVVDVQGDTAPTHRIGNGVIADPDKIIITGPSTRLNPIEQARAIVFLSNARETRTVTRPLTFYDKQGNPVSVSTIDPALVNARTTVTVPIEERAGVRDIPIQIDLIGKPAENYRYLGATANPRTVLLSGPPEIIDGLTSIQTTSVDIEGLREPDTFSVDLELPDNVARADSQPIVVEVEIEPILTTDIIITEPQIVGLTENLTATLRTNTVRVVVFGPLEALNTLSADEVRVDVDVFGLEPGTHDIPPTIDIPIQDIEQREIRPTEVTVEIMQIITQTITDTETLTNTEGSRTVPLASQDIQFTKNVVRGSVSTDHAPPFDRLRIDSTTHHYERFSCPCWPPQRGQINII